MEYQFDHAHSRFTARVDVLRKALQRSDIQSIGVGNPNRELAAAERASIYVWLAAALERFLTDFTRGVIANLSSASLPRKDLVPQILVLSESFRFDRLQQLRKIEKWHDRAELMEAVLDDGIVDFASAAPPLDGRTIEPIHFEILWRVFQFDGASLPGPRHKLALLDLREGRNKLAHGEVDADVFGRGKPTGDVNRLIRQIEDIAEHVYLAGIDYVDEERYRRK